MDNLQTLCRGCHIDKTRAENRPPADASRRYHIRNGPRSLRSYFPTGGPDDPPDLPISPTDTGRNYANCGFWWGVLSSFPGNPVCASNNAGFSRRESLHIIFRDIRLSGGAS